MSENTVHDQFRDLAQKIWVEHGIRVQSASFDWLDIITISAEFKAVKQVHLETSSNTFLKPEAHSSR